MISDHDHLYAQLPHRVGGLLNSLLWCVHRYNGSWSHAVRIRAKHLGVHQIERTGGGPAQFFIWIANIEQPQRGVDEGKIHPKVVESLIKQLRDHRSEEHTSELQS